MPLITTTPPTNTGTLWYDTSNANSALWQLKIYNSSQGGWVSVAEQYVKKSGDAITGSLTVVTDMVGLTALGAGSVNGFFPAAGSGPTVAGRTNATVMFNTGGAGNNAFNVSNAAAFADTGTDGALYFQVASTGVVSIRKGVLNMNANKIINVASGTATTDAVNYGQLNAINTNLSGLITDLTNNKVNRAGDTMTGALTITGQRTIGNSNAPGEGTFTLVLNGSGNDCGGILINNTDNNGDEKGIDIVNAFGVGGSYQSVFSVIGFNGNTIIGGTATIAKATTLQSTLSVASTSYFGGIATMDAPITSIVNNRHLTTKEYVDTKIAGLSSTDVLARVNPASPRNGDILINGALIYIYNSGWKQVFPSQWAD
ncbi:hemagglutinin [compost metagenome]